MKRFVCLILIVILFSVFAQAVPEAPEAPEAFKRFVLPPSGVGEYVWDVVDVNDTIFLVAPTDIPEGLTIVAVDNQLTLIFDSNDPGLYTATIELAVAIIPYSDWTGPAIMVSKVGLIQWWVPDPNDAPFIFGQRDILLP